MNGSNDKISVLMVCLGNICRSPLAEAALRAAAERDGVDIEVDSAGTGDWHLGNPPDIGDLRARQVTSADFERFDHIVAMDVANLGHLQAMQPKDAKAKLSLMLDYLPDHQGKSVVDPYYGDEAGFDTTWRQVSVASEAFLKSIA